MVSAVKTGMRTCRRLSWERNINSVGSALRHGEDRKEVKRGQVEVQDKKRGQGEEQEKKRGQEKDQEKKRQ